MSNLRIIDVRPETTRLDVLRSYDIIDTHPEKEFDEVVRLASVACETPAAGLSFIDQNRCWLKARVGMTMIEIPREQAICNYAFKSSGTFLVPDTRIDTRFMHLPVVAQEGFHFYAGIPLITAESHSLGTLFILDRQPRELSSRQLATLRALANHTLMLLERRRAAKAPPTMRRNPTPQGGGSVLIVDDDANVLAFAKVAVERLGYAVLEASNGQQALELLIRNPGKIDTVLTDVNMPVMDGLELIRNLKKLPMRPGIVVMSGRFEGYIRSAFQAEEVTNLLGKPFSVDELELALLQAKAPTR